jgi:hypothetical protein
MKNKEIRIQASIIRKKIVELKAKRDIHLEKLLNPQAMIKGCFYEVYKSCSKSNCCCQKGKKHGPFPALFISKGGKRRLKMVRKRDLVEVKKKALAYRGYQKELACIRKLTKQTDHLLEKLKKYFMEEYERLRRKKEERRNRIMVFVSQHGADETAYTSVV